MTSIRLHSELGVNPRLTEYVCPCCGSRDRGNELLLLGANNSVWTCNSCSAQHIGRPPRDRCQNEDCGRSSGFSRRELRDSETLYMGVRVCSECEEFMRMGVVLISVKDGTEADEAPYRTGCMSVVKEEAIRRMVVPPELAEQIIKKRLCYVPDEAWDRLGLPREDIDNREDHDEDSDTEDS